MNNNSNADKPNKPQRSSYYIPEDDGQQSDSKYAHHVDQRDASTKHDAYHGYTAEFLDNEIALMLADIEAEASTRLPNSIAKKSRRKTKKRARTRFFSTARRRPLVCDKHIDALFRRYSIGWYDSNTEEDEHRPLWFESFPDEYEPYYRKHLRKAGKKARKLARNMAARYPDAKPGRNYRKATVDWLYASKLEKRGASLSFDPREIINLDCSVSVALYPMMAEFRECACGYGPEFETFEDYIETAVDPVIEAMELHLFQSFGDLKISEWCDRHWHDEIKPLNVELEGGASNEKQRIRYYCAITARICDRIAEGYSVFAKYLQSYWL